MVGIFSLESSLKDIRLGMGIKTQFTEGGLLDGLCMNELHYAEK